MITELVAIDKAYLDEILRRDFSLQDLKSQMMKAPLDKPFTRMDFNVLMSTIDKLHFAVSEMEKKLDELEDCESAHLIKEKI